MKKRFVGLATALALSMATLVAVGSVETRDVLGPLDMAEGMDPVKVPFLLHLDDGFRSMVEIARELKETAGQDDPETEPPKEETPAQDSESPADTPEDPEEPPVREEIISGSVPQTPPESQAPNAGQTEDTPNTPAPQPPEDVPGTPETPPEKGPDTQTEAPEPPEGGQTEPQPALGGETTQEPTNPASGNQTDPGPEPDSGTQSDTGTQTDPGAQGQEPGDTPADGPGEQLQPEDKTDPGTQPNPGEQPQDPSAGQDETGESGEDGETGEGEDDGPEPVDDSWFDDVLFIGDSRTLGLREYCRSGNADYFCSVGMSVFNYSGRTESDKNFSATTLVDLLGSRTYGKIFISLGINECGYPMASLIPAYQKLVDKVRELQPDAILILQGIMAVSQGYASTADYFSPQHLADINTRIEDMADGSTIFYIDVNTEFADEEGFLPAYMSGDGCHLYVKYYQQWEQWIRTAVADIPVS